MTGELAPRSGGTPVPFGFGKELRQVNGYGAIALRQDQLKAALVEQRIDNALYLAARGGIGLTNLNSLNTTLSKDNPGLEMELRHIEEGVAIGIRNCIVNYINR